MLLSNAATFLLSCLFITSGSSQPISQKRHFKIALQKTSTLHNATAADHQQVVSFLAAKQKQTAYNHGSGKVY